MRGYAQALGFAHASLKKGPVGAKGLAVEFDYLYIQSAKALACSTAGGIDKMVWQSLIGVATNKYIDNLFFRHQTCGAVLYNSFFFMKLIYTLAPIYGCIVQRTDRKRRKQSKGKLGR